MTPTRPPLCMSCRLFNPDSSLPPTCTAFPMGIPDDIYDGRLSHLRSINGEPTFQGTIPVGWEGFAPTEDGGL